MGKTVSFRRVVNQLFFSQDPHDSKAVVPVYYSFSDEEKEPMTFAKQRVSGKFYPLLVGLLRVTTRDCPRRGN